MNEYRYRSLSETLFCQKFINRVEFPQSAIQAAKVVVFAKPVLLTGRVPSIDIPNQFL